MRWTGRKNSISRVERCWATRFSWQEWVYAANHSGEESLDDMVVTNPEEFPMNKRMASPSPLSVTITSGVWRAGPLRRVGSDSSSPAVSCPYLAASKSKTLHFKASTHKNSLFHAIFASFAIFFENADAKTRIFSGFWGLQLNFTRHQSKPYHSVTSKSCRTF